MEITLLTTAQRRSIADNYRAIEQIRELIGLKVEVGPKETLNKGETGQIIGWRFNESGGVDYVIRLFCNDQCVFVSRDHFQKKGYTFIG